MERLAEIGPIDDLFAWLESFTAEMIQGAHRDGQSAPPPVWDKIQKLVEEHEAGRTSYDSLYCYIAASHALHEAGEAVRAAGDEGWARDLHAMGQMFLKYGVSDINKMLADISNQIVSTGAVVDGGKSVH
jgi:hypothetical protein